MGILVYLGPEAWVVVLVVCVVLVLAVSLVAVIVAYPGMSRPLALLFVSCIVVAVLVAVDLVVVLVVAAAVDWDRLLWVSHTRLRSEVGCCSCCLCCFRACCFSCCCYRCIS